jgi:MscS family membrane protein
MFSSMVFVNASRMTNRRVLKSFTLRYEDEKKVGLILQKIRDYIYQQKEIDQEQSNFVHLEEFGNSGIEILLRVYSKTIEDKEFRQFQEKILFDVHKIIQENGAQMAFPTQVVYLKKEEE